MADPQNPNDESSTGGDAAYRKRMEEDGFRADSGGLRFGAAAPKILVAGAYKVIRTAAERARGITGKGR